MFYSRTILSLTILACLLFSWQTAEAESAERPNILLILVDDMGYSDLGCYGSEIETPNIDKLAAAGIKFTHFTNCAKCETTRTTLMSGRYHTEVKGNSKSFITIPENLALAGYQNFMVGKWHIFDTPNERGFDRYFGFLEGATNFFTGEGTGGGISYKVDEADYEIPENFYSTDFFANYAIKFIGERDKQKPFFLYLAFNAPHYPLQAPKEDVMKYRGKYTDGWEVLRKKRFQRMKELDIIPKNTKLSKPESDVRKWDSLSDDEKDNMDLRMATYAAMIDRVDQQVGRIIKKLKTESILDNTLVVFLSDNGACPFDRTRAPTLENNYMPWDGRSYYCYPREWANACNTPLRLYKQNQNEGGIATSMIAHWPKGISVPGTFNRQRGHLIDFHATFRELAGAKYPTEYQGNKIGPARGISLVPSFTGKERPEHEYLYQNFADKYTAIIKGKWKLVDRKYLYDLEKDRIESNDLSKSHPEKFQEMLNEFARVDKELNNGNAVKKANKNSKKKK
ncbi:MAG: sulfatase [Blastopirellula sp.]|nr:MAG: sulfatase [Blastopirellula sp.]